MRVAVPQETMNLSRKLLASEADDECEAAVRVCNKLRDRLGLLVGVVGFKALLHRALARCKSELSSLEEISIGDDGSLAGFEEWSSGATRKEIEGAGVTLVGHLLALLETFIGNTLTWNLLQDIWPKLGASPKTAKMGKI